MGGEQQQKDEPLEGGDDRDRRVVERIAVLYGSQTGNSEQAARDFCSQVVEKLHVASALAKMLPKGGSKDNGNSSTNNNLPRIEVVGGGPMQLDDFLEQPQQAPSERCRWPRLVVIFTSSYGVGGPPLGCYRFRDLCDAWLAECKGSGNDDDNKKEKVLDGVVYALCGLGDSKYTTFFENPKTIDDALTSVGARRVGPLGKADASGTGPGQVQSEVIERWIDGIWPHLAKVVVEEPLPSDERFWEMQQATIKVCRRINPEFGTGDDEENGGRRGGIPTNVMVALLVAILAAAVAYYYVGLQK